VAVTVVPFRLLLFCSTDALLAPINTLSLHDALPIFADGGEDICGHDHRLAGGLTLRMAGPTVRSAPAAGRPAREPGEPIGHNAGTRRPRESTRPHQRATRRA